MGVTLGVFGATDSTGWTTITASEPSGEGTGHTGSGTRKVYLASAANGGSDSNPGTQASPKLTISAGLAALRDGSPDWLLLKKGDTWTNEAPAFIGKKGFSATEPMVITSYGTGARPLIKTNPSNHGSVIGSIGGTTNGDFLAVIDLDFYAYTRDPDSPNYNSATIDNDHYGMRFLNPTTWLLIEGCRFRFYENNILQAIGGSIAQAYVRRCVIIDNYLRSSAGHSQGVYTENVTALTFEENIIDHNGWNETISGAERTQFNHGLYSGTSNSPHTVRGNIFTRNSSHGATMNNGGEASDNLFVRNAIGLHFKRASSGQSSALRNIILESEDHSASDLRGWGLTTGTLSGYSGTLLIDENIIANEAGGSPSTLTLTSGVTSTVSDNKIYNWMPGISGQTADHTLTNNFDDAAGTNAFNFTDPTRSVGRYNNEVRGGTATLAAFLTDAREQRKDSWNAALTALDVNTWIRAGFAISGGGITSGGTANKRGKGRARRSRTRTRR